jgi:ribulose-phosphate 3-epimerase
MKIVPAILTDQREDLQTLLTRAEQFAEYVQIDFMDGSFVPSRSVFPGDLQGITTSLACEAHLMVERPDEYLRDLLAFGFRRIIFHFEANTNAESLITAIKQQGCEAGIALNPDTSFTHLDDLVSQIDAVLFLSVNPGFYGSAFIPSVLDKIRRFRQSHPSTVIGIDGGVALDNVMEIKMVGVTYACVGSRIMLSENPADRYRELSERAMR